MTRFRTSAFFLLAVLFFLAACGEDASVDAGPGGSDPGQDDDTDPPTVETRSFQMGVSGLVPRNWPEPSGADWADLFAKIPEYGELWGVHTGWNEGELDDEGVPIVVQVAFQSVNEDDAAPYAAIGVEPDRLTQEEADTYFLDHGDAFRDVCVEIARRHQPEIFLIGVEINRFYEKSPGGFEDFLDVYAETYDAIKSVSPATVIGSNFMLEYMRGAGARSGTEHEPHWDVLDRFGSKVDLVTFTTYPFFDYDRPGDVPEDYLDVITQHTSRPIMITETGWPTEPIAGVEGSEQLQADFLANLVAMVEDLPLRALVWAFPHDIDSGIAGGLFDHISLRRNDGTAKRAFDDWEALRARPIAE